MHAKYSTYVSKEEELICVALTSHNDICAPSRHPKYSNTSVKGGRILELDHPGLLQLNSIP